MRVLELPAGKSPREWGRIHGESFRGEVKALAQIRIYLCTKVGGFAGSDQVLGAARAHLPVLERYDAALFAELCGIAEGAAVTPEEIVVANHYTDLRDLDPDPKTWRPAPESDADPGGCSVIFAETASGRVLAQTWDMHATAIPYVMLLALPDAKLLTVTGCLGMAGMNQARVAIAINNLFSTDATLGVVWPAMVRRALREPTAVAARDLIVRSPIGSGHHYFVADDRHAFGIEASGTKRRVVYDRDPALDREVPARYFHTNHALDPDIAAASKVPPTSTTFDRMRHLEAGRHARLDGLDDAWRALGSEDGWPKSVCTNMATPESPHGAATCGAIAMNIATGEVWAQQGFVHNVAPEKFHV
ncbi:MAG TPA: C45 family peptidase [Kofleriaceae bacterium]|nr:C45 family peptidase [Kofleriaceae bacterium]